jgi:protoporphyrinogen oxidase
MPEDKMIELCLEDLSRVVPGIREKFLGAKMLKTPIAYPVYLNEYEDARKAFEISTNVDNLLSIGRNGEFSHIFMEDVYWRTRKKVGALVDSL